MHGGAQGSGAPKQNKNALKHGKFTKESLGFHKHLRQLMKESRKTLEEVQ
jgi:uncharacterized protein YjcR